MRITDFNSTTVGGLARVSATVTWEDSDRPKREIYIETDPRFTDSIRPNPNAFLLAAIMPAMHHNEERMFIDGQVCPQLRNGLNTAMRVLQLWYGEKHNRLVTIEASKGFGPPRPPSYNRNTASFLSGGVDALATLRCNRLDFPLDHPGSIKACFFVHGTDVGGYETRPDNRANSDFAIASLTEFAEHAGVTLIPVFTNVRHLDESDYLFAFKFHGAALAAIAQSFSSRISTALIASSDKLADLVPWGSHPLLDPNYSSANLSLLHDGLRLSRPEKVGLIAEWDAALQVLRSCLDPFRPANALNCGKCEKCIRTMTELLVYGKLGQCPTYNHNDVSPDLLAMLKVPSLTRSSIELGRTPGFAYLTLGGSNACHWRELIDPLHRIGRHDLVQVIENKLAELEKYYTWMARKDVVKRLDRRFFGGGLTKLKRLTKRNG